MNQEYPTLTIDEVCEDIYDGPHATPEKIDEGPIFLGVSNLSNGRLDLSDTNHISEEDFQEWTRRVTPKKDDLVFSYETRLGEAALIPEGLKCCLGRRMGLIRAKRDVINPRYLLYAWLSPEFQRTIHARASQGSTVNRILLTELGDYPIRVPPLPIQRRIADILGTLDDKIELNRQMNQTLEAMAQALYKRWFVDFGPFQDGEFVDSELGPIPKGWEVKKLDQLCHQVRYGYTESATDEPVGPKFLRIADINKQPWVEWSTVPHCPISEKDYKKFHVRVGDIFIARMADPGHGVMIEEEVDAVFASYLIRFVPKKEVYSRFLQYWMRSDPYWRLVDSRKKGSTRSTLNAKQLKNFPLVVPPEPLIERFSEAAEKYRRLLTHNVRESETLAETRDYLLPKLISGEIEVEAAEEAVEEPVQEEELDARQASSEHSIAFTIDAEALQRLRSLPALQVPKQLLKVQTQVGEIVAQANDISKAIAEQVEAVGRTGQVLSSSIISAVEQVRGYEQVFRSFDTTPFITLQRPLGSAQLEFFQDISSLAANVAADLEHIDVEAFQRVLNAEFHAKLKAEPEIYEEAEVESILVFVADWFLKAVRKFNGSISTETLINMILTVSLALFTVHSSSKDIKALRQSIEQAVETQGEAQRRELIESRRFAVTADLNLRAQPSKDSPILDTLSSNQVVELIREEEAWAYVKYTDHAEDLPMMGWVQRSHLKEL